MKTHLVEYVVEKVVIEKLDYSKNHDAIEKGFMYKIVLSRFEGGRWASLRFFKSLHDAEKFKNTLTDNSLAA